MKVLKFAMDDCQPCKALSNVIGGITDLSVDVTEVDVVESNDLVVKYGIRSVPTLVLVDDDGREIRRKSGNMSEKDFKAFVAT